MKLHDFRLMDSDVEDFKYLAQWVEIERRGLFWRKTVEIKRAAYGRGGTTWHYAPSGERCSATTSLAILDAIARLRIVDGR